MNLDRFSRKLSGEDERPKPEQDVFDAHTQAKDLEEHMRYEADNIRRTSDLAEHIEMALESFDAYKLKEVKRRGDTLYIVTAADVKFEIKIN